MILRDFYIRDKRNKLSAVLHEPLVPKSNRALIIAHGFRGSKDGSGKATLLANAGAALGYSVIRFDFTPLQSLSCQVTELSMVVDYCRSKITSSIVLLGRSMGGSAALAYTAKNPGIAGVCLWATPWDLHSTFKAALGNGYNTLARGSDLVVEDGYGKLTLTPEFIHDFDNYNLLACIRAIQEIPVCIVHGTNDQIVNLAQAKKMFACANQPKRLIIIQGADHQFSLHAQEVTEGVINWLAEGCKE